MRTRSCVDFSEICAEQRTLFGSIRAIEEAAIQQALEEKAVQSPASPFVLQTPSETYYSVSNTPLTRSGFLGTPLPTAAQPSAAQQSRPAGMDLGATTGMDLSNITLFDGSRRGADYHSWAAAPDREVTRQVNQARAAGRTVDAVDRLDMVEKYLQHDSEAFNSFGSLRKISSWRLDAAAENCFTDYHATQDELTFVLGMSVHLPGLKEGIKDILKAEFSETYSRAFRKGWVRTETQLLSQATQEILGRPPATPATAQASGDADTTSAAEGEPTPARAAAVPENRMFVCNGKRSDPNTYAYKYVMHLFSLKYSQATYEQEAAFNTLTQGNSTEEVFANELQRQAAAMRHKPDLNERTIIMRFVNGLNDTSLAADLLHWLQR